MKFYRFITGEDNSEFCHRVTEALSNGWELYGNPQMVYNTKSKKLCCGQAIIKKSRKRHSKIPYKDIKRNTK